MISVRQMAGVVHPSSAVRKVMVVLKAYFDESGLHSSSVFALAGYVATEKDWERFEKKWQALLQAPAPHKINSKKAAAIGRPLDCLHAVDMEGLGKGRFRSLGQRNRDYLKRASVDIVLASGVLGIASAVIVPEYERLDASAKEVIGDPYILCFQHVIAEVNEKARLFLREDHSEGIAYIFEQQPKWQIAANEMWVKSIEQGYKRRYRMGAIAFGDKKDFLPLQAADRNAFETYQHFSDPVPRDIWRRFVDTPQHTGKYFNRPGFASLICQLKASGKL